MHYMLAQLLNAADEFQSLADDTIRLLEERLDAGAILDRESAYLVIRHHAQSSDYKARIMEVAMHALMQALEEVGALGGGVLEPLSQMRSANKKHGNVGDIEVSESGAIVESWDAKYGKSHLRDELEEINDKLPSHLAVRKAGFVTSGEPERLSELEARRTDIENTHEVSVEIASLEQWTKEQFERAEYLGLETENQLARRWMRAYTESLALRRTEKAPIDEPCQQWLMALHAVLDSSEP